MASAVNRFGTQLVRHSFRTRPAVTVRPLSRPAPFSRSAAHLQDGGDLEPKADKKAATEREKSRKSNRSNPMVATAAGTPQVEDEVIDYGEIEGNAPPGLEDDGREGYLRWPKEMTREERDKELASWNEMLANPPEEAREAINEYKRAVAKAEQEVAGKMSRYGEDLEVPDNFMEPRTQLGLMAQGEDNPMDEGPDDEVDGRDITSLAHGDLEQHREHRHYMRLAAWEMPLLSKFAQEFKPPGKDRPLRFRHTTYLGEKHPAANKIVVEFCTADLPLEPKQRLKLVKLVGSRYDPQTDIVRMSSQMHDTAAQNKRYLGDLVDTLVAEARNQSDAEGGKDKFDDVPVDFRHVKWKTRHVFPEAWKITPERRQALQQERTNRAVAEQERRNAGLLIDGATVVEEHNRALEDHSSLDALPVRARVTRPGRPMIRQ